MRTGWCEGGCDVGTLAGPNTVYLVPAAVLGSWRERRERETLAGGVSGLNEDLSHETGCVGVVTGLTERVSVTEEGCGAEGGVRGTLAIAGSVVGEAGEGGEAEKEGWVTAVVSYAEELVWREHLRRSGERIEDAVSWCVCVYALHLCALCCVGCVWWCQK